MINTYGMSYEKYTDEYLIEPESEFRGEGKYFHYTSLENCINMLNHENDIFEMWASHVSFLNDKEEMINGLDLINRKVDDLLLSRGDDLSDWIEEYKEQRVNQLAILNEVFVICFCSKRSLLSQWKYYGKNSGVAIEYNLDRCKYAGYIDGKIEDEEGRFIPNYVYKVIYDNLEKQQIIDDFIKKQIYNISQERIDNTERKREIFRKMDRLYSFAPLFKHDSFQEENESRLLFRPLYLHNPQNIGDLINYRVSDGRIVPYMKIKIRGNQEGANREPVIKSLTVGPGQNQDLIFQALKHIVGNRFHKDENQFEIIDRRDYSYIKVNGVEIRKVSMPFRG